MTAANAKSSARGLRKRSAPRATVAASVVLALTLYGACTEQGADLLLLTMTGAAHADEHVAGQERAIVLLTGDHVYRAPAAAALQRETGLPLIVSGRNAGYYFKALRSAGAHNLWPESSSTNTEQNAAYSACLLASKRIDSVFVVTDEAHMPRALAWFGYYGVKATPAVSGPPWPGRSSNPWLPSRIGWSRSKAVVHEWMGLVDFAVRSSVDRRLKCPEAVGPAEM
jgi:uncharacterized SAM-binding protein YcdF (DUF218 family)